MILPVVGKRYLFMTVTFYYDGIVAEVDDHRALLKDTWWVSATGKFAIALASGKWEESEYVGDDVVVNFACTTNWIPVPDVPRELLIADYEEP